MSSLLNNEAGGLSITDGSVSVGNGSDASELFDGLSLRAERGSVLAVLGRSGAGKSSLLNCLVGLAALTRGSIQFDDRSIAETRQAGHIAYLNQQPLLLPWLTVEQNYELAARVVDHETGDIDRILEGVNLADEAGSYPATLSGGMYQRIAFGRAIFVRPQLLLLDEPFSALDEVTRLSAYGLLRDYVQTESACCLLVTHDISETLSVADRLVVLSGRPASICLDETVPEAVRSGEDSAATLALRRRILDALQ